MMAENNPLSELLNQLFAVLNEYDINIVTTTQPFDPTRRNFYFTDSAKNFDEVRNHFAMLELDAPSNYVKYTSMNTTHMALNIFTMSSIVERHKCGKVRILDTPPDTGGRQVPTMFDTDPYAVLADAFPGDYVTVPGRGTNEFFLVMKHP